MAADLTLIITMFRELSAVARNYVCSQTNTVLCVFLSCRLVYLSKVKVFPSFFHLKMLLMHVIHSHYCTVCILRTSSLQAGGTVMLHPGQHIRPHLSQQMATKLVQRLYGLRDIEIVELNGYDDKNYHVKVSLNNRR
jgi:hypothetical protein